MEKTLQEATKRSLASRDGVEDPNLLQHLIVEDRYASIDFFSSLDTLLVRNDLFGLAEAVRQFIIFLDEALIQVAPYLNQPSDLALFWMEATQVIGKYLQNHVAAQKHYDSPQAVTDHPKSKGTFK